MEVSAIIKILVVFAGVLAVNRLKTPLGIALMAGGVALEFWAGRSATQIGVDFIAALSRPDLWLLLINISLITELGYFMAEGPNAQAMIASSRRLGGKYGHIMSLVAIPAAIGLVPMPGGALFSAPLVGETVKETGQSPEWKAAVNYWFRHVMEYWWPLYPVVIVTLSIFTIPTWQFMAMQAPFTAISIAAGYFFLLRPHLQTLSVSLRDTPTSNGSAVHVLLPIFFIVLCTLLLPGFYKALTPTAGPSAWKLLGMLTGLVGGLLWIAQVRRGDKSKKMFANFWSKKTANMLMTLAGVLIFQSLLQTSELLPEASRDLSNYRMPVEVVIAFLPFIAGLVTGIAIGFAGAAFPLVVGFMGAPGSSLTPMATLVLAFSMGYAGMMFSPVHLCFVLTKEYFMAPFSKMYRYLTPCVLTVVGAGLILHVVFRYLGW